MLADERTATMGLRRRKAARVAAGERPANSLALVPHKLTTDALRCGLLATRAGQIAIAWRRTQDRLVLHWTECGGPPVAGAPAQQGFGAKLIRNAIVQQLGGTVIYDWQPEELALTIRVPVGAFPC